MAKIGGVRAGQIARKAEKKHERMRILLSGDATSGKTTSLLTLPDALKQVGVKEPKIVIIDLDQGADGFIDEEYFEVYRFGGIPGSEWQTDEAVEWWIGHELPKLEANVVVGDSLSALSMMALATVTHRNGRFGSAPQLQDWNHEMHTTQKFCLDLQNLPITHAVITTCHTAYEKDDVSGRAYNNLVLTGKLPRKLIRFFPEIYYADVTGRGQQTKFEWLVAPEEGTFARTQMGPIRNAGPRIKQDFGPIFKARFG